MDLNMIAHTGIQACNTIPKGIRRLVATSGLLILGACGGGGGSSASPTDTGGKPVFGDSTILSLSATKGTIQANCIELPDASATGAGISYSIQEAPTDVTYAKSPEGKNCLVVGVNAPPTPKGKMDRIAYIAANTQGSATKYLDLFVNAKTIMTPTQLHTLPNTPITQDLSSYFSDANGDTVRIVGVNNVSMVRGSNTNLPIVLPYDISTIAAKVSILDGKITIIPVPGFNGVLDVGISSTDDRDPSPSISSVLVQIEDPALTGVFSGIQPTTTFNTQSNYQITSFRIGTGTGTYGLKAGSALPPGLTLSPDGTISGTYIPSKGDGTPVSYTVTFVNTDATGVISEKLVTWTFQEPFILSAGNSATTSQTDNIVTIAGTKPSEMVFDLTYLGINITTATVTTVQDTPTIPGATVTVLDSKHIKINTNYTSTILVNPIVTLNGGVKRTTFKSFRGK